ncbi:MAG TPA: LysM peptidoglycan-binding domain-containing protein [Moorella mulderi]|nr:LysM peptidoglycan-binding domain-containing protein [Moorella mulderi]
MLLMALLPALPATAATYYVQPGDSLYLIGQRYGLSPWELQQVNNLSSTVIYPGQALWVPRPGERIHVVKPGGFPLLHGSALRPPLSGYHGRQRYKKPLDLSRPNPENTFPPQGPGFPGFLSRL